MNVHVVRIKVRIKAGPGVESIGVYGIEGVSST